MSAEPRHTIEVDALGTRITIDVADAETAKALRRAWAPCLAPLVEEAEERGRLETSETPRRGEVSDKDFPGSSGDELLELLTQRVTIEAIGLRAGELLMFHACAVANETGDAVVMVGPSGMGKTTMARTHGSRWGYVTDETAAITADGTLLAYPKPLSVIRPGQVKAQVSRNDAGLLPAEGPLRVRAVLLLERGDTGVTLEIERVDTIPGIALLAEHTSYLARMEQPLARIAELLHEVGGLRRVRYAEAMNLTPLLTDMLGPGREPNR